MDAPRFALGQTVATRGALAAARYPEQLVEMLTRHHRGDPGCVDAEDAEANNQALVLGGRILSAYPIETAAPCEGYGENCLWIITEADRSITTILLPAEY